VDQGPAEGRRRSGRHGCQIARVDGQRPYASCYQIEKAVAEAFDKAGLTAFESLIRS
jgi:hypothetical protein